MYFAEPVWMSNIGHEEAVHKVAWVAAVVVVRGVASFAGVLMEERVMEIEAGRRCLRKHR